LVALARGSVAEGDNYLKTTRRLYQLRIVDASSLKNFFTPWTRVLWNGVEVAVRAMRVLLGQELSTDQALPIHRGGLD
jgi:hypothetical protein